MIKYITSFFTTLNKNSHPGEIAHAVSLGTLLAVMPKDNLLWVLLFVIILFVRINKGAFFISLILLGFLAPFCDVLIERIGYWALTLDFMQGAYAYCDTIPFVGWTKFYNTMVMGGLLFGLLIYIPVYFLTRVSLAQYRKFIRPLIEKFVTSKLAAVISKIPILRHIKKLSGIGDALK